MVKAVRQGESLRRVARRFHVSVSTVYYWTARAEETRLGRVDWQDRSHRPHRIHRTKRSVENVVIRVRTELKDKSILGEYGAEAIQRELLARGKIDIPAVRTIGRILERRGALDGRHRITKSRWRRSCRRVWVRQASSPTSSWLVFAGGGQAEL